MAYHNGLEWIISLAIAICRQWTNWRPVTDSCIRHRANELGAAFWRMKNWNLIAIIWIEIYIHSYKILSVFLLLPFPPLFSENFCMRSSIMCLHSGRSSPLHPKRLKPGYVVDLLTSLDDVTAVLSHSAVTSIYFSAFNDNLLLCTRQLWHILADFASFLPH